MAASTLHNYVITMKINENDNVENSAPPAYINCDTWPQLDDINPDRRPTSYQDEGYSSDIFLSRAQKGRYI